MTAPAHYSDELGSLQFADLRAYYSATGHDPTTLVRDLLARFATQVPANVWISRPDDATLLAAAAELSRRWPDPADRPPLWGIPIAVKDNVDVRGLTTTAGCPDFRYEPVESAQLVQRLLDAGALIVGKTNMDQFASGLTGARSAYGVCRSPFDPDYIGGGSSSGSGLAVALGLAAAAIGTDTAGSGRVPAAFGNIVGLKPSRGLVSGRGIVPACRSLDCASVFALSVADASAVLSVIAGSDAADAWSRPLPVPPATPTGPAAALRVGYCELATEPVDAASFASYRTALETLTALGAELIPVDFTPFRFAGDLLYDGPWVAERLTQLQPWLSAHPNSLLPVTATVFSAAATKSAVDAFRGFHRLAELVAEVAPVWSAVDVLVLPTVPQTPTVAETQADPHSVNTRMGRFTMFANLLDLAAAAVPATIDRETGLPSGVTFLAPAGQDAPIAAVAAAFQAALPLPAGATPYPVRAVPASEPEPALEPVDDDTVLVAVVGAHRTGQPLHHQLVALNARTVGLAFTAPSYRLYALPTSPADPIRRPGMVRVTEQGESIELELHRVPITAIGAFLVTIPAPLGLGVVELADGSSAIGFLCEAAAVIDAVDVSEFKSWPNYLGSGPG